MLKQIKLLLRPVTWRWAPISVGNLAESKVATFHWNLDHTSCWNDDTM